MSSITKTITVHFPSIMKMYFSQEFKVSQSIKVDQLKTVIFNGFWRNWSGIYPETRGKHGSIDHLTLRDGIEVISTNSQLQKALMRTDSFNVVFTKDEEKE